LTTQIGRRRRRAEGIPVLLEKFAETIAGQLPAAGVAPMRVLAAHVARPGWDRGPCIHEAFWL